MVSLAGLSAVYPGQLAAQGQSQQNDLQELQLKDAKGVQQGRADFARGLMQALVPGAQAMPPQAPPQMAPQAPPPGQPSQPMRPPQPPPVAPPGPAAGGARGPQLGMQPGAPPAGAQPQGGPPGGGLPPQAQQLAGRVDLRSATQGILKANPGIQQDPQRLYYALKAGEWILNDQAKQQLADMRQQMQADVLGLRRDALDAREADFQQREQRIRDEDEKRENRFKEREQRLGAQNAVRTSQTWQRLEIARQDMERKVAAGAGRDELAKLKLIMAAQDKEAQTRINAYSSNNSMDAQQKEKLLQEQKDQHAEALRKLDNISGLSGGKPNADGTKTSERAGDRPKPIPSEIRKQFDDALAAGKPKEALLKRLQEQGYTTEGL